MSGRITSLTPGRNAPYPLVSIIPVWESGSAACSGLEDWSHDVAFAANAPGVSAAWCTIFADPIEFATGVQLTTPMSANEVVESDFTGDRTFTILESDTAAALAALGSPSMWAVGLGSNDTALGCLLASGVWLVAATGDTGCPAL